ncbi:MAG: acetylornithine transaminase [Deltaproteobacteria bacterium]|nr:acetylornithine transaminase [Deltaproteobacteria bacterium]MBW2725654.1 acetylornithine transaminase [Deltaproteobacteria bacterium]
MASSSSTGLMSITARPDAVMARGRGSWLWDEDGRRYLDFVQGWAVNCLGHAPEIVRDALAAQAGVLLNPSPAYHNRPQLDFAAQLSEQSGLDRVFFCNSGAEANEGAIKLARKWGKRNRAEAREIITFTGAFHGRTLATMAATDKPGWDTLFAPAVGGFRRVEFGNLAAVEAAIGPDTVAVMLEPVQGEAGVVMPAKDFLPGLRELTEQRGLLLILDEIQTGMGRTGPLFAHRHWDVTPDIMTLGKGIGAGVPLAALLARESVSCFEPGDQGGTFNGNPLMAAVGLAVLSAVTEPAFIEHTQRVGRGLMRDLERLASQHPGAGVRGLGHLLALTLPKPCAGQIAARCFEAGLLINAPRPNIVRFMPALTVAEDEVKAMLAILEPILSEELGR